MANDRLITRHAVPEDAVAISGLLSELGYTVSPADAAQRLHQLGSTGSDPVYLAVEGLVPVGLIAVHWTSMLHLAAPVARITALVVSRNARRQGVGRCLTDCAIAMARRAGCDILELTTAAHRGDAHAFYRATGFTQTSTRFQLSLG